MRCFTYEEQWNSWIVASVEKCGENGKEVQVTKKWKEPGSRVSKGEDYWSMVYTWFAKLLQENGADLNSAAWQVYYLETVRLDCQHFGHGNMPPYCQQLLEPLGTCYDTPATLPSEPTPEPSATSGSGSNLLQQMRQQHMSQ